MNIEIKNRFTGEIIVAGKYDNIKEAVENKKVNLRGANLCEANLCGANLRGADLCGADLYGANLRGANLHIPIVSIIGSVHSLWYSNGLLKIGCEKYSLEYWIVMYDVIGRENNYNEEQIKEYYKYIKMIRDSYGD
jgi:hypothetical protein